MLSCSAVSDSLQPHGTIAYQAPLSMGFSRQEYWNKLPCPPPGDLPNTGIKPRSSSLQVDSLPSEPPRKPRTITPNRWKISSLQRRWQFENLQKVIRKQSETRLKQNKVHHFWGTFKKGKRRRWRKIVGSRRRTKKEQTKGIQIT